MATNWSLCTSTALNHSRIQDGTGFLRCGLAFLPKMLDKLYRRKRCQGFNLKGSSFPMYSSPRARLPCRRLVVLATTKGSAKSSESEETIPSWARPDSEEPPPWARDEGKSSISQQIFEVPFYVYLLASAITAIAAIGSIFEYVNERPVFGIVKSDSIFYAPLLGFFVFTGIPMSGFLWFKSVKVANKEAEEQDRRDGFL
ncbi:hypothetical protein Taro_008023 [Colocasia esculenta]|uniref:Uncharacterized protein n=1 Tax=Colocasia esculenta TaxID=4460 RepID=A0A843U0N7_COLES|nr:hypothetical protein [Colocasia esculenta]